MIFFQRKIFFIFLGFLFFLMSCKEKETSFRPSAIVLLAMGDVKVGEKNLQIADRVSENEVISVGEKSLCDIQILGNKSDIVIRMKALSSLTINSKVNESKNITQTILEKGNVLIHVKKLNQNEELRTLTPTVVSSVRGTKYELVIDKTGDTNLFVYEGSIATKQRIPEIENLSSEKIQTSESVKAVLNTIDSKESILEAGNSANISKNQNEKILKETGLGVVLADLKKDPSMNIDTKLDVKKVSEKLSQFATSDFTPTTKQLDKNSLEEKLKECEELISIEKEKLQDPSNAKESIQKRNKDQNQSLLKRIETIMGKASETLVLKNGQRYSGVLIELSNSFLVISPEGKKEIPKSEVERTEF